MTQSGRLIQYYKYNSNSWEMVETGVIAETPVSLTVNGEIWLTFMCTPTHLEALAAGFLYTEGIIDSMADVADLRVCEHQTNVDVWLHRAVEKPKHWRRTSGCTGGQTGVDTLVPRLNFQQAQPLSIEMVLNSMDLLFQAQELYRITRGVHCSGLSDGYTLRLHTEDIGRHNTLDKIAGLYLMEQPVMDRKIIVTTGRISSEMLLKSARLGVDAVISRTSPSLLSIELAEEAGITLIGYARRNQFNVYTHPERLGAQRTIPVRQSLFQAAD